MSPQQLIFVTTLLAFALTAGAYYRGWAYAAALCAAAYFAQSVWLAVGLVLPDMPVIFALVVLVGVALPTLLVVLFTIDVWFGAFVLDMAYGLAFAWLLSPLLFVVNLLAYSMGGGTA